MHDEIIFIPLPEKYRQPEILEACHCILQSPTGLICCNFLVLVTVLLAGAGGAELVVRACKELWVYSKHLEMYSGNFWISLQQFSKMKETKKF